MKRSIILIISAIVLVAVGIAGVVIYKEINWEDSTQRAYRLNSPMVTEDYSITVTEVVAADRYTTPDGTEYTAVTDGKLLIVKCRVDLEPGWMIQKSTNVGNSSHRVNLLCDPILEAEAGGEESQILLFSLPSGAYNGRMDYYSMELSLRCGDYYGGGLFSFN